MSYSVSYTNRFKKDLRRCIKRNLDISKIQQAVQILERTGTLPVTYKSHKLKGNSNVLWECHIEPDWLLVWEQDDNRLTLLFVQTGTHSDLFR